MSRPQPITLPALNTNTRNSENDEENESNETNESNESSASTPKSDTSNNEINSPTVNISSDLFSYSPTLTRRSRGSHRARQHLLKHTIDKKPLGETHSRLFKNILNFNNDVCKEISYNDCKFIYTGISYIFKKYLLKNDIKPVCTTAFYVNIYFLQNVFHYFNKKYESEKSIFHTKDLSSSEMRGIFYKHILSNGFLKDVERESLVELYYNVSKIYYTLQRFARRLMLTKIKRAEITTDLCMNELSECHEKHKITIIDRNVLYEFKLTDLLNIVNTALSNYTDVCLIDPLPIKNPYTNLEFSTANLYNIFYKVCDALPVPPILLYKFYLAEFDITSFTVQNDTYLMNNAICNYVKTGDSYELYHDVLNIFEKFKTTILKNVALYRYIEKNNATVILNECRNILRLYYLSEMSNSASTRIVSYRDLRAQLSKFAAKHSEDIRTRNILQARNRRTRRRIMNSLVSSENVIIESNDLSGNDTDISGNITDISGNNFDDIIDTAGEDDVEVLVPDTSYNRMATMNSQWHTGDSDSNNDSDSDSDSVNNTISEIIGSGVGFIDDQITQDYLDEENEEEEKANSDDDSSNSDMSMTN